MHNRVNYWSPITKHDLHDFTVRRKITKCTFPMSASIFTFVAFRLYPELHGNALAAATDVYVTEKELYKQGIYAFQEF